MSGKSILKFKEYEEILEPLTKELSDAARWISETGQRLIVIFEGRDTAGKGGSIDMIASKLNPRQCQVAALPAPSNAKPANGISSAMRTFPVEGGDHPVRPQLVQSRRRRDGSWAIARRRKPRPSCKRAGIRAAARRRWLPAATNIGCAATRSSRKSGSSTGSTTARGAGNCPRSISKSRTRYQAYTEARERMLAATHTA